MTVMNDTPTPRTDGEWNRIACLDHPQFEQGLADFARQLERELANMTDQRDAALWTLELMKKNHEREADDLRKQRDELAGKFTKLDKPMYSGNPMLDSVLKINNPEFDAWVKSQPPTYWARYDLSAARIGWEAAMTKQEETTP